MSCNMSKVCLQAKRVFDACLKQYTLENQSVAVTFDGGVTPVTFTSLENSTNGTVSNLTITPVEINSASPVDSCYRVSYTVTVPVTVTALTADNTAVTGTANLTLLQDTILKVPTGSIFPAEIENLTKVSSVIGTFDGAGNLVANICVAMITKSVAEVELFVPSYGYLCHRPCTDFADNICRAFNNRPLFPSGS